MVFLGHPDYALDNKSVLTIISAGVIKYIIKNTLLAVKGVHFWDNILPEIHPPQVVILHLHARLLAQGPVAPVIAEAEKLRTKRVDIFKIIILAEALQ